MMQNNEKLMMRPRIIKELLNSGGEMMIIAPKYRKDTTIRIGSLVKVNGREGLYNVVNITQINQRGQVDPNEPIRYRLCIAPNIYISYTIDELEFVSQWY